MDACEFDSRFDEGEDISPYLDMANGRRGGQELDDLPLPYTFDVQVYESIRHEPLKRHIDEFGKTLYRDSAASPT